MKPRWHEAKVIMDFFTGACFAAQHNKDQVKVMALLGKDGADSKYILIGMDEFNERLKDKSIQIKRSLSLKEHITTENIWKKAKDCSHLIFIKPSDLHVPTGLSTGMGPELEAFQAQSRLQRQATPPVEVTVMDLKTDLDGYKPNRSQSFGKMKRSMAALLSKPEQS